MSDKLDIQSTGKFDLVKTLLRASSYWYWIPICLSICIALGIYMYRTSTPIYKIKTQLLISGGGNNSATIGGRDEQDVLSGVSLGGQNQLENQLIILTSSNQVEKTINQLDFSVSYYMSGLLLTSEIYKRSPIKVLVDTTSTRLSRHLFHIDFINDKEFYLTIEGDKEYKRKVKFFEKIEEPRFAFSVHPVEAMVKDGLYVNNRYSFKFNSKARIVRHYKSKLKIQPVGRSSIYEISITENNVQKGIDFLNKLAQNSVNYTLEKKNVIANNKITFIDNQLVGVTDSLDRAKEVLENFRSRNEVMNVSMKGQMIIEQSQELEAQRHLLTNQLDYYNYLLDYLQTNSDVNQQITAPSSQNVNDPTLSTQIAELSNLNAEKASLQFNSRVDNPNIKSIDRRIETIKNSIIEITRSLISTTNISLNDLNDRIMSLSNEIRRLPRTEQKLLDIQRNFEMSEQLYTYLMQKRSDAQLAKASNLPDNEVIESAIYVGRMSPNSSRIGFLVLFLGVFIPTGIIFLIIFFNDKIQDKDDLEGLGLHIIGSIPQQSKKVKGIETMIHPRSAIAEAYRSIRTSMEFYKTKGSSCYTIMMTSTIPGEGKSFCSANLAISYAQLGKKTILLGFDLRKPTLHKIFDLKANSHGLSRYLVNDHDLDKRNHLIEQTNVQNLDVILTGEVPPNPVELIAGEATDVLFTELKQLYDIIIIDTPPLGLVSDAVLLTKYSDVNILTTRHNYTPRSAFLNVLHSENVQKMKNLNVCLNGLPLTKKGYSYGHQYGLKSDYYVN
ncbi:GumC family protein [Carboxylicivirga sp. N1Y90]|uniref:GumC family protein n=1 Tax=Carboxylicivirga fragile TaxID=3417571 RepID=UPI003D32FD7B|nr:polysaccharide biosynthesis tyrosine autokinase [Marinilabiliaceae bacterium N1Y90]